MVADGEHKPSSEQDGNSTGDDSGSVAQHFYFPLATLSVFLSPLSVFDPDGA
jgi:hypothetical protein